MLNLKLNVGTRIFITSMVTTEIISGLKGTIIKNRGDESLIEFDNFIDGHSGDGSGRLGFCWWVHPDCYKKILEDWDE